MLATAILGAAAVLSSWLLPTSPNALAVGDVDGDGRNEVVLLLVWPSWSSMAVNTSPEPMVEEVEVTPAIKDRRELWTYRLEDGRLKRVAEPLSVGREILAIAPTRPLGPVVALDDEGLVRLDVDRTDAEHPRLMLNRVAALRPVLAGAQIPLASFPLLVKRETNSPPAMLVPTARGLTLVAADGRLAELDSPFREVRSGKGGSLRITLPRRIDLDGDGRVDLLYIGRDEHKIALRRGLPDGSYAAPVVWDIHSLIEPPPAAAGAAAVDAPYGDVRIVRRLVDVLDADGDGVLEAVIYAQAQPRGEGLKEGMKAIRGLPGDCLLFPLRADGSVSSTPSAKIAIAGEPAAFDHPEGWVSPFRDLDGDGRVELVAMTFKLGYLGVARAIVTKKVKLGVVLHVYRRDAAGWGEVKDAAPEFELSIDLQGFEFSRFFRLPGDLDGDGRAELVLVDGKEVEIYPGLAGARFAAKPKFTIELQDPIRAFQPSLEFIDLDGDGRREMLAFELQPRQEDQPSRSVRLELRSLEAGP